MTLQLFIIYNPMLLRVLRISLAIFQKIIATQIKYTMYLRISYFYPNRIRKFCCKIHFPSLIRIWHSEHCRPANISFLLWFGVPLPLVTCSHHWTTSPPHSHPLLPVPTHSILESQESGPAFGTRCPFYVWPGSLALP